MLDPRVERRILASMNFEEGDRVPIWDYLDNTDAHRHFAQPGDTYDQGMIRVYHGLGIDLCRGYGRSFAPEEDGQVQQVGNTETRVSGRTRWLSRRPIRSLDDLRAYQPTPITEDYARTQWVANVRAAQ
ncbi:MAG: hypothetical protein FJ279_04430, partial [Planctomycetes bacterium]|nr:hypothetical protein [Planctomycetota bacterium]